MTAPIVLLLALLTSEGFTTGHEPYPDAPRVSLVPCSELEWPELHTAVARCGARDHPDLAIRVAYTPDGATLQVNQARTWVDHATTLGGLEAYSARLNSDDRPDAIVVFWGSGCGLAAAYCSVVFALSDAETFAFWRLETMGFGPAYLLTLPGLRGPCIVHTAFVNGEPGKDGRTHNYWVSSLFRVRGTLLEPITAEPVWIMYALHDNHVPTRQLFSEQKRRLRREQAVPEYVRLPTNGGG